MPGTQRKALPEPGPRAPPSGRLWRAAAEVTSGARRLERGPARHRGRSIRGQATPPGRGPAGRVRLALPLRLLAPAGLFIFMRRVRGGALVSSSAPPRTWDPAPAEPQAPEGEPEAVGKEGTTPASDVDGEAEKGLDPGLHRPESRAGASARRALPARSWNWAGRRNQGLPRGIPTAFYAARGRGGPGQGDPAPSAAVTFSIFSVCGDFPPGMRVRPPILGFPEGGTAPPRHPQATSGPCPSVALGLGAGPRGGKEEAENDAQLRAPSLWGRFPEASPPSSAPLPRPRAGSRLPPPPTLTPRLAAGVQDLGPRRLEGFARREGASERRREGGREKGRPPRPSSFPPPTSPHCPAAAATFPAGAADVAERPGAGLTCQGSPRPLNLATRPPPAPAPPRLCPCRPRQPEPGDAPAAEVRSPWASRCGDRNRAGGLAGAGRRVGCRRPRRAPGHCESSPRPRARLLLTLLAGSRAPSLAGSSAPALRLFAFLHPSFLPPPGGRAGAAAGPGAGANFGGEVGGPRRGRALGCGGAQLARGYRILGTKLSRAAAQLPLPMVVPTAALGLFGGKALKGASSLVPESLSSATPGKPLRFLGPGTGVPMGAGPGGAALAGAVHTGPGACAQVSGMHPQDMGGCICFSCASNYLGDPGRPKLLCGGHPQPGARDSRPQGYLLALLRQEPGQGSLYGTLQVPTPAVSPHPGPAPSSRELGWGVGWGRARAGGGAESAGGAAAPGAAAWDSLPGRHNSSLCLGSASEGAGVRERRTGPKKTAQPTRRVTPPLGGEGGPGAAPCPRRPGGPAVDPARFLPRRRRCHHFLPRPPL
ncbi:collagen, type I, alpha 1a-like [Loxodonta africana]|uniref:collagen, type I, alpha 1a-like n=1 Tax=Loxodonta africana TaxID=9785 RepID=UPI0030D1C0EC